MAEESTTRLPIRCVLNGEIFDFNEDLGAVAIGKGAACTPCMDRLFNVNNTLHPNGERPQMKLKGRQIAK